VNPWIERAMLASRWAKLWKGAAKLYRTRFNSTDERLANLLGEIEHVMSTIDGDSATYEMLSEAVDNARVPAW